MNRLRQKTPRLGRVLPMVLLAISLAAILGVAASPALAQTAPAASAAAPDLATRVADL